MRVHVRKDRLGQPVPVQDVTKAQDRGLVGDAVVTQFDPGKAAHRLAVIERLVAHRVAQRRPNETRSIVSSGIGGRPPFGPTFG